MIGHIVQCWWFRLDDLTLTDGNRQEKYLNIFGKRNWGFKCEKNIKIMFSPLKRRCFGNYLQFKTSSLPSEEWKGNSHHIFARNIYFLPVTLITKMWKILSVPAQYSSFTKLSKPYSCKRSIHTSIMKQTDRKWHKHNHRQWCPAYESSLRHMNSACKFFSPKHAAPIFRLQIWNQVKLASSRPYTVS